MRQDLVGQGVWARLQRLIHRLIHSWARPFTGRGDGSVNAHRCHYGSWGGRGGICICWVSRRRGARHLGQNIRFRRCKHRCSRHLRNGSDSSGVRDYFRGFWRRCRWGGHGRVDVLSIGFRHCCDLCRYRRRWLRNEIQGRGDGQFLRTRWIDLEGLVIGRKIVGVAVFMDLQAFFSPGR